MENELYVRLAFLAVGLFVGWLAGMATTARRLAKQASRDAHEALTEVQHLKEDKRA